MNNPIYSRSILPTLAIVIVIISCAVETDIFLPSFPALKDYFATSESKIQLLISMNFLGLGIASFFYGPLADTYGRRPILLIGMFLFAGSSIACAFAKSFEMMLFWRFIQGLGSSVAFVVPKTIIHDSFDRKSAAKILGIYGSLSTFVMSFAPIIGNYLYLTFSWHANFIFIAILAVIAFICALFFIPESLHIEKRILMHPPSILKSYKKLLINPIVMANLYLCCAISAAYFVYIANLSLIFVNHLGVDKVAYGYYQSVPLIVFAIISFSSGKIIARLDLNHTRRLGVMITTIGSVLFLLVAIFAKDNPLLITLAMAIFTGGFAINVGIFSGDYLHVYPEIKGIAAALGSSIGLFSILIFIFISGALFDGTIMPIAYIIFFSGATSLLVLYWLHAQKHHHH